MTGLEQIIVVFAGFGAGILSSSVGVASLLSFPVLLAVGLPPVVANVSNTIGLIPAGLGGAWGYRRELRTYPAITRTVIVVTGVGGAAGAALLLGLPAGVFEAVVPWLILGTCVLVGTQQRISRFLASRLPDGEVRPARVVLGPVTLAFVALTGVYGGYFGAGAGVMMIAVLAFGLDISFTTISAIRTVSVMASNIVAGVIFALVAEVDWTAVLLLAAGSIGGGYVGARIARVLPTVVLRTAVVIAGVSAAVYLWI